MRNVLMQLVWTLLCATYCIVAYPMLKTQPCYLYIGQIQASKFVKNKYCCMRQVTTCLGWLKKMHDFLDSMLKIINNNTFFRFTPVSPKSWKHSCAKPNSIQHICIHAPFISSLPYPYVNHTNIYEHTHARFCSQQEHHMTHGRDDVAT